MHFAFRILWNIGIAFQFHFIIRHLENTGKVGSLELSETRNILLCDGEI